MADEQNWRIDTSAEEYFGSQKKQINLSDRRPVIRKPSDLVGPGIAATAVSITDFNDLLATYNGYFSAITGTFGAPNDDEPFVGFTVADGLIGGVQTFTGMGSGAGLGSTYSRRFIRNPSNYESLTWDSWRNLSSTGLIGSIVAWPSATIPALHFACNGGIFDGGVYPELAAVLGGTTLPDLRNRAIYGLGSQWSLLGSDGLSEAARTQMLNHIHSIITSTAPDHSHGGSTASANVPVNLTTGGGAVDRAGPTTAHAHGISADGSHFHSGNTLDFTPVGPQVRGLGLNYIIKAG